jgi:predicted metal-binding membrane protein
VSALFFVVSAALTIVWCGSMTAMQGTPMPGGWTLSMAWTRMPGQTWASLAVSFLGAWVVMMAAMMLPSLVPRLWHYREAVGSRGAAARLGWLTTVVGCGYFLIWTLFGMAVFPVGAALAALEMQVPSAAREVPLAAGFVVLLAGTTQFTAWKTRHLRCCRQTPEHRHSIRADVGTAWRHGRQLGVHCSCSCAALTVILLVFGVMDLRAMALVTAAITVEHLAPAGEGAARTIGAIVIVMGLRMIVQAALLG